MKTWETEVPFIRVSKGILPVTVHKHDKEDILVKADSIQNVELVNVQGVFFKKRSQLYPTFYVLYANWKYRSSYQLSASS